MDKLGIFGGTFNPVHNGHLSLAQHYIRALGLDRLLVIPTQQPPHKAAPDLAPASVRLHLCRLAFAGVPEAVVSDMEVVRSGKSYTVDTVAQLRARYPHAKLYLLVGSDMFLTFSQWRQWQQILQEVTLCTAARADGQMQRLADCANTLQAYGRVQVFDFPVLELSSTQVRERISQGLDCTDLLNPQVYAEIQRLGLYRQEKQEAENR